MSWLSSMCRRTASWLLIYPHSFTHVGTSKRSLPRHHVLQMCSTARNFSHQATIYMIWTSALLNLGFSASSAQHLAPSTIAPTKVLKSNEPTNSLWWLSWSRSYQTMVPHSRISSVPHTRRNSSERVCGTKYHTLNWQWVCGIPHTLWVCGKRNAQLEQKKNQRRKKKRINKINK